MYNILNTGNFLPVIPALRERA